MAQHFPKFAYSQISYFIGLALRRLSLSKHTVSKELDSSRATIYELLNATFLMLCTVVAIFKT